MKEFLHRHPGMESRLGIDSNHVIVDICDVVVARDMRYAVTKLPRYNVTSHEPFENGCIQRAEMDAHGLYVRHDDLMNALGGKPIGAEVTGTWIGGIDFTSEYAEKLREEGRQEIRDAVTEFRMNMCPDDKNLHRAAATVLDTVLARIAPKSRRYVVAPADAELKPDAVNLRGVYWPEDLKSVTLIPGWTSDKECRYIVAKLLRDGVEIMEEN